MENWQLRSTFTKLIFIIMFKNKDIALTIILIAFGVIFRIVNNEFNLFHFNPTLAIALVAGMTIQNKRVAALTGLAIMLLTDVYFSLFTEIPGYYGLSQLFNYVAVISVTALGFLMKKGTVAHLAGGSIGGVVLFFLLSNFGVWAGSFGGGTHAYTSNFSGLVECFTMALPFLKDKNATMFFMNSVCSTLFFAPLLYAVALKVAEGKKAFA